MDYGIQLYSMRDVAEKNLEDAVRAASELGYRYIEFAGFFGHTANEIAEMLNKYGVAVSGTHSSYDDLVNKFEETMEYHKAIGNKNYIIPCYDLSSQEKLDDFIDSVNLMQKKMEPYGITLGYHNHHHEFKPNSDGSVVYEQLLYRTGLKLELDTYWAFVGMKNPLAVLDRIKNRVHFIHIKDGSADGNGTPLGMGEAPVKAVWEKAKSMGIQMVVESETCTPDGPTEAKICIEYLRSLEK